jgi:ADP-heptose:LPS heptosyltransferase
MSGRPTVLVLRALGLGDLVTGLPALHLLRAALPHHRIVLATPRWWNPIVRLADVADDTVHGHELEPLVDPPRDVELAIDLHGSGPASRDLLNAARPRRTLAYCDGPVPWRRDEHDVARWCRLLRDGLPAPGRADPPVAGALGRPPDTGQPVGRTLIHCGAAAPSRRWPPARFAAVARELQAEGHDVAITGGPGERELAREIGALGGVDVLTDLDVTGLLDLVGHARLLISGDTGVAHLAAAYAIASVTLFGPVSPARWGPPPLARHQVLWHGDDTGDPHGTDVDPALLQITPPEVVAAARRALAACEAEAAVAG